MGFVDFCGDMITEHRSWLVLFLVAPLSFIFDLGMRLRAYIIHKFYSAPELHAQRIIDIQKQIKKWKETNDGTKLCTARPGWASISPGYRTYKKTSTQIKVNLFDILELDTKAMTVRCEPMVTMGDISHYLIPKGYTIPVVPEMDDLTIGGLLMGVGIEGSSHVHGLFAETCVEMEIILSSGEVMKCSKTENADVFDALPWSYGTLGFLASATIKIVPAKQWVHIKYTPCKTLAAGDKAFQEASCKKDPAQFVEALAYSKDTMVVMEANMCDDDKVDKSKTNRIALWFKPWFYKHVEKFLETGVAEEYIPLRDYYHRHSKSIFWELELMCPLGNHPIFRWTFGAIMPPKVSFLKLTQTKGLQEIYEKEHVIQDMLMPVTKLAATIEAFHEHYELYPLWICPHNHNNGKRGFLRPAKEPINENAADEMYVDIGAYGVPRACLEKRPFDVVDASRKVEDFVVRNRGFQMLYAECYQTKEEFEGMFDHAHYFAMREKLDAAVAFPTIFDKVRKQNFDLGKYEASKKKKQ